MDTLAALAWQVGMAVLYYGGIVLIVRFAGKRLAGQTSTFDLVVLIQMAAVVQKVALGDGLANGLVFLGTVFAVHVGLAVSCRRWHWLRRIVRGDPRPLVRDGRVSAEALAEESLSHEELMAGLRKQGCDDLNEVRLAVLEETGHISVVRRSG